MSDLVDLPEKLKSGRRGFLGTAGVSLAGLAVAGAMGKPHPAHAAAATYSDNDILNFALNLEYLEAEYYSYAVHGTGIPSQYLTGTGTAGSVISTPITPKVTFYTSNIQQYAQELANEELNHVIFLRSVLGSAAVAQPQINIGTAFNTLAQAAGIGSSFDPFSTELNFLLGSFIFEDVGVTAYHGAAALISDKTILTAAAGILGTEAYHAGAVRAFLTSYGTPGSLVYQTAGQIANLRDALDGPGRDDYGLDHLGMHKLALVDENSIVYARTFTNVLNIVYGNTTTTPGLFFPQGVNGVINS